jgi:hypothetical protein
MPGSTVAGICEAGSRVAAAVHATWRQVAAIEALLLAMQAAADCRLRRNVRLTKLATGRYTPGGGREA